MKISFFQFLPEFNDLNKNIKSIEALIDKNIEKISETDLLVFPEYFLSGPINLPSFDSYKEQLLKIDVKKEFSRISKKLPKVAIVFGSLIYPKDDLYLNLSLVYKDGKELGGYDKKALIYNENYICKSTNNYFVFEVEKIKVGIAICWDLILPEVFRKYTNKVDLMIIPSFWGIGGNELQAKHSFSLEKKYYRELCTARAYENAYSVLFVNSTGKYQSKFYTDRLMGGSIAIMPPLGKTFFTNSKKSDDLHIVNMNFKFLEQYRKYYATDKDYKYYKSKKIF